MEGVLGLLAQSPALSCPLHGCSAPRTRGLSTLSLPRLLGREAGCWLPHPSHLEDVL